jgi:hypothetical protein
MSKIVNSTKISSPRSDFGDDYYAQEIELDEVVGCWESATPKLRKLLGLKDKEEVKEIADDYYRNPIYHPKLPSIIKMYMKLSQKSYWLVVDDENFNYVVIITIVLAGILVGAQTYPYIDELPIVNTMDLVILGIFTIECATKIVMEGLAPWRYFTGSEWKWNCFDFAIVFMSFPQMKTLFGGGGSIALLRLVRLARLGKLIRKIPPLQMIVKGLIGGLSSITYIMILLLLVLYLYGVMGFYLYAVNDPFHFGSVPLAMFTLFRVSTLENWGDIMFLNILGCDKYPDIYVDVVDRTPENHQFWCENPAENSFLGTMYFVSFIVLSAFVMLSLFIGAVTMSMNESMEELKKIGEEAKKKKSFEANKKKMDALKISNKTNCESRKGGSSDKSSRYGMSPTFSLSSSPTTPTNSFGPENPSNFPFEVDENGYEMEDSDNMIPSGVGSTARSGFRYFDSIYRLWEFRKIRQAEQVADEMNKHKYEMGMALMTAMGDEAKNQISVMDLQEITDSWLLTKYKWFCKHLRTIVADPIFSNLITFAILIASFNVGAQTDPRIMDVKLYSDILHVLDEFILIVFTIEVVMKILGEEFHPWTFFNDNWNTFDFLIVVSSYLNAGSAVTMLRLLRLLRVLKLVKRLPQLAVIINALIMGLGSIGWVGLVLFLFFYVFAIVGMILFHENDPFHFSSLHAALISLFRLSTLDEWSEAMYINQFGCDVFPEIYETYPHQCRHPKATGLIAVIYYVIFIIIGAQVLLTLFIGVIATSMDEARELQKKEQELDRAIFKIRVILCLPEERIIAFRKVFSMLDLDNGGSLEEEELRIGMEAVGVDMSDYEMNNILNKVDPQREGVNVVKFIEFMCETPMYKKGSTVGKAMGSWKKKEKPKRNKYFLWFWDNVLGLKESRLLAVELKAAVLIQTGWRHKLERIQIEEITKKINEDTPNIQLSQKVARREKK